MQKKFLLSLVVAVLCGSFLGHTLFQKVKEEEKTVFKEDVLYFLEEGVYDNVERAENATKDIDTKVIVKEDNNYYVYLAITSKKSHIERLKELYPKKDITVKEMQVENKSFKTILEQMDGLVEKTTTKEELETINKVILANYEEIILKS